VLALGLSVFLVFVIMAIQFESLLHPLVILFSVPLAFFGSVVLLRLMQVPVSVVVFLGMIMLAGIVVNNAIVLVDYINQLRRRGMPKRDAIVSAGEVRLRPILMTTATTVLGLLPMALTVIAGLISSTVLTLVLVPGIYSMLDRIRPVVAEEG
jgi:HAE1 family hydrophobic/amphiphilic exporter-1